MLFNHPLDLVTRLSTVALSILGGAVVTYILLEPRHTPGTYELLTSARAQLGLRSAPRLGRSARLQKALRRKVHEAGLSGLRLRYLLLTAIVVGLSGLLIGRAVLGTPLFGLLCALLSVYLLWNSLSWRARLLTKRKRAQIIEFIAGMATSIAGGSGEREAFNEQVEQLRDPPLSFHLARAQLEIDPRHGLGGRGFIHVLATLDEELHDPLFHTFYTTVAASYSRSVSLAEPLKRNAAMARHIEAFTAEAHADFASPRLTALIGYSLPCFLTVIMHVLEPRMVEDFYNSPLGSTIAIVTLIWCRLFYWLVLRTERRITTEARGG